LIEHISDLRNTHKDVTKKLSSLRDQIVEINTKISQLYRIFDKYNSLQNNICPECEQEVSKEHVVEKINSYEAELQDLAKQRDPLVEDHGELIAILDKLSSKIELQESALRKERHTRDQESELQQRWQSKLSKLEDRLGYDQRDFELIKTQANPYKKQLIQLNEAILKLDQDLILVREDKEEMQWQADTYAFWQQAYKEIRLQLIDQTLLEIEVSANRASEALGLIDWRIEFATERQTKSNTVSRGFSSFIYPPDKAEPIRWESYSGGEEQRWRLAATFALSETLLARAGLATNLEILDEPTIHLSEGGISDLLDYLRDRALDLNRCIYLIDHHILDKGSFDSTICIERTERGSIIKYI
jgi:DNA repair exonuclease SbcCD ATPase subunit